VAEKTSLCLRTGNAGRPDDEAFGYKAEELCPVLGEKIFSRRLVGDGLRLVAGPFMALVESEGEPTPYPPKEAGAGRCKFDT